MAILTRPHQRAGSQVQQFFRRLSTTCSSERSTFTVESVKKDSSCTFSSSSSSSSSLSSQEAQDSTPLKKVCFCEHVRVYQDNKRNASVDVSARWYTKQEIERFQSQAKNTAKAILQADSQMKQALHQNIVQGAYQLYTHGLVDYDMDMIRVRGESATHKIGLTGLAASCVLSKRRSPAHERLAVRLQDLNSVVDLEQRARLVAQASSCASQSSRLCAAQLARWWATHPY